MEDGNLDFHCLSWVDPIGRLFWKDGNLYRGIRQPRAGLYRDLLAEGFIRELVDRQLLVDTWATEWTTSEFPLIVRHRVLPVVSFVSEWCGSQLKAAALSILELELALRPRGLTLRDINPWNLLFDGVHPLYVDFSSIAPLPDQDYWASNNEFNEFYLYPLLLFEHGLSRVARRLLCDPWTGIKANDLQLMGILPKPRRSQRDVAYSKAKQLGGALIPPALRPIVKQSARAILNLSRRDHDSTDTVSQILALRDRVAKLAVIGPQTRWAGYYENNFPDFTPSKKWTSKHHSIYSVIEEVKPQTLLDIGANRGWYSQMAASRGVRVIAADSDETSINELYSDAKTAKLGIHSVFMDIRFPEPAQGPGYKLFESAAQRFKSDMVLALAIVHHMTFAWDMSFQQTVENLAMFSTKWLVVEFIGRNDPAVQRLWKSKLSNSPWYNLETFKAALGRHYTIVKQVPSDSGGLDLIDYGPDDRTILVCQKKTA